MAQSNFGRRGGAANVGVAAVQSAGRAARRSIPADDQQAPEAATLRGAPNWARLTIGQTLFGLVVAFGFLSATWFLHQPHLFRDQRLRNTFVVAPDIKATSGDCQGMLMIVSTCSVTFNWNDRGVQRIATTYFLVGLSDPDGTPLIPVRSRTDAGAISVLYAIDTKMQNRVVTFWSVMVVSLAMAGVFARRLVTGRYYGGSAHRALID